MPESLNPSDLPLPKKGITPLWKRGARGDFTADVNSIPRPLISMVSPEMPELEDDRLALTPKMLVEKRLAESLKDVKQGRVVGPFRTARSAMKALNAQKP